MKANKPLKIAISSALIIGAALGAFQLTHAAVNSEPFVTAPTVKQVTLSAPETPAPKATPQAKQAPAASSAAQAEAPASDDEALLQSTVAPEPTQQSITVSAGSPVPTATTSTPAPEIETNNNTIVHYATMN